MNMYMIKSALADALCVKESSPMMQELFARYVTPNELMEANELELKAIKGVGPVRARQIVSTLKLARALNTPRVDPYVIRKPEDAFQLMRYEIGHLLHEEFHIINLSTKNHVICTSKISVGSLNAAIVHPREVFREAIKHAAASILCLHNHPSGDCTPSSEDIQLSKRLADAGNIIGIDVLDSLVIASHKFSSLKEKELM